MTRQSWFLALSAVALAGAVTFTTLPAARADTVRATLTYKDGDTFATPIRRAKVEIWRLSGVPWPSWVNLQTVTTSEQGFFSVNVPFAGNGSKYALRVFATNPAVQVFTPDFYTIPFWREPGRPDTEIISTSTGPFSIHDFTFNFTDDWARQPFNIADAVLRGFDYANARRDNRETDTLVRMDYLLNTVGSTYYDPISHAVRMDPNIFGLEDITVLHEYAHYLEERLSSFYGIASDDHDGCMAHAAGVDVNSPGYAWMEGFADYFARAVQRDAGSDLNGPLVESSPSIFGDLETPSCPGTTTPVMGLEKFVVAALLDIIDSPSPLEPNDELCAERVGIFNDRMIFEIFDHELDHGFIVNPTLQEFVDAWIARGHDLPPFFATLGTSGIAPPLPPDVLRYDSNLANNLAIWRPGVNAEWWILGGESGGFHIWGTTGDKPVPADYDGDGFTDIAVWRNGTWFIKLSASGIDQVVQWGTTGDVPLPGDYDGDGEADLAVYRPDNGTLYIHSDGCGPMRSAYLGYGTPVVGNFNGGEDDPGLFAGGTFTRFDNIGTTYFATGWVYFGGTGIPVIADYDLNGLDNLALYRPATGMWDIRQENGTVTSQWWGDPGDVPVPGDYDGNGVPDIATWSPGSGTWWILESDGPQWSFVWGVNGDVPVPAP